MSSLLELDSSFTRSTSADSTTTTQSKGRKRSAPCWEYCRRATPNDPQQDVFYCAQCTTKPYSTRVSKNMTDHLKRHHKIVIEPLTSKNQVAVNEQLTQLWYKARAEEDDEVKEFNTEVLKACLNTEVITEALVSLIVVRNLSFTLVEWPEFHTFCQVLNSACMDKITTSHSGVYNKVKESWLKHKDIVRQTLQAAISRIHISLDIWTSPNRLLLLAICAHFTTYDRKKQHALLALKRVPGHSGEDQFSILLPVLNDYGIIQKIGAVVSDNASTNNVLCRILQNHMLESHSIDWDADELRIRCIGHILNLAVQAFLFADVVKVEELESYDSQEENEELVDEEARRIKFRLLGPLGQAHNIVIHIRGSPGRTEEFRALAGRLIPLDNRTRWNSWNDMLAVVLKCRPAVEKYCQNHEDDLEGDILTYQDWRKLSTIRAFLSPFVRATYFAEGYTPSIDATLFTMDVIIKHLQEANVSLFFSSSLLS
jgi:hypothetical protein